VCLICSQDQLADTLTKSLSSSRFLTLRTKLTVTSVSVCLRGLINDDVEESGTEDARDKTAHTRNHIVIIVTSCIQLYIRLVL
jgi:hypothetical protein